MTRGRFVDVTRPIPPIKLFGYDRSDNNLFLEKKERGSKLNSARERICTVCMHSEHPSDFRRNNAEGGKITKKAAVRDTKFEKRHKILVLERNPFDLCPEGELDGSSAANKCREKEKEK